MKDREYDAYDEMARFHIDYPYLWFGSMMVGFTALTAVVAVVGVVDGVVDGVVVVPILRQILISLFPEISPKNQVIAITLIIVGLWFIIGVIRDIIRLNRKWNELEIKSEVEVIDDEKV